MGQEKEHEQWERTPKDNGTMKYLRQGNEYGRQKRSAEIR